MLFSLSYLTWKDWHSVYRNNCCTIKQKFAPFLYLLFINYINIIFLQYANKYRLTATYSWNFLHNKVFYIPNYKIRSLHFNYFKRSYLWISNGRKYFFIFCYLLIILVFQNVAYEWVVTIMTTRCSGELTYGPELITMDRL